MEEEPTLGLRGGQPGREEMVGLFLPVDPAVSGQELALVPMAGIQRLPPGPAGPAAAGIDNGSEEV